MLTVTPTKRLASSLKKKLYREYKTEYRRQHMLKRFEKHNEEEELMMDMYH